MHPVICVIPFITKLWVSTAFFSAGFYWTTNFVCLYYLLHTVELTELFLRSELSESGGLKKKTYKIYAVLSITSRAKIENFWFKMYDLITIKIAIL